MQISLLPLYVQLIFLHGFKAFSAIAAFLSSVSHAEKETSLIVMMLKPELYDSHKDGPCSGVPPIPNYFMVGFDCLRYYYLTDHKF
jgi:hypothetical protein